MRPCLVLLAALALVLGSVQSYEYGYEYGYDGLYGDDAVYDYLDDYGYYSDDGDLYYEVSSQGICAGIQEHDWCMS